MILVHGSCVAISGIGILLRGPAGAGKSDLALRVIGLGGRLVADDQVELRARDGALIATSPKNLVGLLEVRGLGIMRIDAVESAVVGLVVDLVGGAEVERQPRPVVAAYDGVEVPLLRLEPFEASAALKLKLAVTAQRIDETSLPS